MAARAESWTTGTVPFVLLILPSARLGDFGENTQHLNTSAANRSALSFYFELEYCLLRSALPMEPN